VRAVVVTSLKPPHLLRGREHLHAGHFIARLQGQLLQIY
jgi:hypothetical protein